MQEAQTGFDWAPSAASNASFAMGNYGRFDNNSQ